MDDTIQVPPASGGEEDVLVGIYPAYGGQPRYTKIFAPEQVTAQEQFLKLCSGGFPPGLLLYLLFAQVIR